MLDSTPSNFVCILQEAQAQTQACKRQRLEAGAEGGAGSASEAKEGKDDGVVRVSVAHDAKKCEQGWDPKSLLFNYCRKYDHADPVYVAEQGRDKQFRGYVRVLGGTFGPTKAEPNKRKLQQTSASLSAPPCAIPPAPPRALSYFVHILCVDPRGGGRVRPRPARCNHTLTAHRTVWYGVRL